MKVCSCSGGTFLMWGLVVQMVLGVTRVSAISTTKSCKLSSESASERKALSRLEPLTQKNFTFETTIEKESYQYIFQLCGDADGVPGAGLIQINKKSLDKTVIGRYNATEAIGGSDWVMFIYGSGDKYDSHCNKNNRKSIVMISCTTKTDPGPLHFVQENREREQDCFYLFEMDSNAVCPPVESKLSPGSIILIIGLCFLAVYLLGGFLYQRFIVGAKGMEQFPNHAFWVEVGNLAADGCDFVCRSRSREEAPAYRGVSTEPLEEESEERDDHLLPM
ncbi:cation-dependent mannose-6-phosphate receptor [Gouania willdenowi]|uniref:Cation-dependent mannose-6-phosphate receptor n=1 Tax=Gouania willdenowi TaxID=441366 RepID=A0A8C5DUK2_GOUWI|nr:cation-dependent mannose-6-phosphate receptor [Gouania willdenowi]